MEDKRRDITTTYPPATTIINNSSSEVESRLKLPEQWQLTKMIIRDNMINRADTNMTRGTHPAITDQQPADGQVPTSIDVTPPLDRTATTIHLTPIEKKAIEAQDNIGLEHFVWSRTANDFTPAIQQ